MFHTLISIAENPLMIAYYTNRHHVVIFVPTSSIDRIRPAIKGKTGVFGAEVKISEETSQYPDTTPIHIFGDFWQIWVNEHSIYPC